MADRRDKNKYRNLNQNKDKQKKARAEHNPEALAFRRSRQSQRKNIKQQREVRDHHVPTMRNSSSRQQNAHFLYPDKNIHSDVKTTLKRKEKTLRTRKYTVNFNRKGVVVICALITILFLYFAYVLFNHQILQHGEMSKIANNQYYRKVETMPKRGDIFDRNGKLLATTTNIYTIGITPKHVYSLNESQSREEIISKLVEILGVDKTELTENLQKTDESYIQIAKNVPQEKAELLDQYLFINQIGGVRLDAVPKRVYMNDDVASQIIGFASMGESALEGRLGIEYQLNDILTGQAGYSFGARDNYLNSGLLPFSQSTELSTKDGSTVYLTIDYDINKELQDHVAQAVDALQSAEGGMGLVMNVKTGEVLAMASYPYFKSSDPSAKPQGIEYKGEWDAEKQETIDFIMENVWRNKVVSDLFEVGSTFKTVTLAMGLEENITSEDKTYSDEPIDVLDYTIKCWSEEGHGYETLSDAFTLSCNPPFVQVSLDLGIEKFYNYIDAFGFRDLSGIELPGEANNIFHEDPSLIDLATLAFGEQSSLNLMSYSKGLSSVVNGGNLMKPTIIKQITNPDGGIVQLMQPQIERRVISEKTSERVDQLLSRNDVLQGVNKVGAGYQLGGKTSTSVNEYTDALTMSYVSFAPIENPEYMVIIVAKNVGNISIGSDALINNVSGMMDWTLNHMNVQRNYQDNDLSKMEKMIGVPDLIGETLEQAKYTLGYQSIEVVAPVKMSAEDTIAAVVPAPGSAVHYGTRIYVYPSAEIKEDLVAVPDFRGKNYNECILTANAAGVVLNVTGDYRGVAVQQSIRSTVASTSELNETDEQNIDDTDVENQNNVQNDEQNKIEYVQRGTIIDVVLGLNDSEQ